MDENTGIILTENTATAMGNYFFTDSEGAETKASTLLATFLDEGDKLRIMCSLIHSGEW